MGWFPPTANTVGLFSRSNEEMKVLWRLDQDDRLLHGGVQVLAKLPNFVGGRGSNLRLAVFQQTLKYNESIKSGHRPGGGEFTLNDNNIIINIIIMHADWLNEERLECGHALCLQGAHTG
jgi:hypothetical protein